MAISKEAILGRGSKAKTEKAPSGTRRKKLLGAAAGLLGVDLPVKVVTVEIPAKTEISQNPFLQIDAFFSGLKQESAIIKAREYLRKIQEYSKYPIPATRSTNTRSPIENESTISLFLGTPEVINPIVKALNKSTLLSGAWSKKDEDGISSIETNFPGLKLELAELPSDTKNGLRKGIRLVLSGNAITKLAKSPALPPL